jgi:hypothetical protein
MDDLRPDALATVAARVVAWHNRHPLARRITAEQVQSVGYVALPYLAAAEPAQDEPKPATPAAAEPAPAAGAEQGKSLRERALERAQSAPAGSGTEAQGAKPAKTAKAAKAAPAAALKPAFTEDFIAPLPLRRVVRWVAEHGASLARAPRDGPVREVAVERSLAGPRASLVTLYVLTAMVEVGGKRVRMLLAGGGTTAVIGSRLWSPVRLGLGAAAMGGVAAAAVLGYVLMPERPAAAPQSSATPPVAAAPGGSSVIIPSIRPPALRASAVAELAVRQAVLGASTPPTAAHSGAAAPPEAAAHAGVPPPARAPMSAPVPVAAASVPGAPPAPTRPVDVEPTLGRIDLPVLGPPRGQGAQAALRERRLAALATAAGPDAAASVAASTAPAPTKVPPTAPPTTGQAGAAAGPAPRSTAPPLSVPPPPTPPSAPAAAAVPQPAKVPAVGTAFAVSSRQLRTRAEAEQIQSAMRALLVTAGHTTVQVELVPAGEDWRVVGWPFAQRAQAESARNLLAARGMRVTVVDF